MRGERTTEHFGGENGQGSSGAAKSLTSGALAGLASVFLLQPLDVVKTRLQELPRQGASLPFARLNGVLRDTLQADGIAGFWRGTGMHATIMDAIRVACTN